MPRARKTAGTAVLTGSFDPPGIHHRETVRRLGRRFDRVVVLPSRLSRDDSDQGAGSIHRAALVDMTFRGMRGVDVELFALEEGLAPGRALLERLRGRGEIWFAVGSELVRRGGSGSSVIQRRWEDGAAVWDGARFAVLRRDGAEVSPEDLPKRHLIVDCGADGDGAEIRDRIFRQQSVGNLVTPRVARYIERYGLYTGRLPRQSTWLRLEEPSLLVVSDGRSKKAREIAGSFSAASRSARKDLVVVVGGDGTMLRAIRKHWRLRVPFFGVNAGHRGFLLNEPKQLKALSGSFENLLVRQIPLLHVQAESPAGETRTTLGFNDAWVERRTGQSTWLELRVDDQVKIGKLVGDGVLVATAAGSTAYARAMGATPILVDSQALLLVGSNVLEPSGWKSAHLSLESTVRLTTLDPAKRPVVGYVDGIRQGPVRSMRIRVSRVAAIELVFTPGHDIARKLAQIQFPK